MADKDRELLLLVAKLALHTADAISRDHLAKARHGIAQKDRAAVWNVFRDANTAAQDAIPESRQCQKIHRDGRRCLRGREGTSRFCYGSYGNCDFGPLVKKDGA